MYLRKQTNNTIPTAFRSVCCTLSVLFIGLTPLNSAVAQEQAPPTIEDLDKVKGEITEHQERSQNLVREAEKVARSTKNIKRKLVTAAAQIQAKEAEIITVEQNIEAMSVREEVLLSELDNRSAALMETIAALQKLQRNPPPALFVHPDDAADAARSALLLSEIAPAIKEEADALAAELDKLRVLRETILGERERLRAAEVNLAKDQEKLSHLLDQRETKYQKLHFAAEAERQRVARLALEAKSLEELINSLKTLAEAAQPRRKPTTQPADGIPIPKPNPLRPNERGNEFASLRPENQKGGAAGGASTRFSKSKGLIRLPATGRLMNTYGSILAASDGKSRGITLQTRPKAQVISPFDGEIVFAGPYLGYGQLLIIAVGEGYHLILAGMERLDGIVGQRLLAGEPVGIMGFGGVGNIDETKRGKIESQGKEGLPTLYFEFRKDGEPFDPIPWLAITNGKGNG